MSIVTMLIIINGFNLLPLLPLDGGRFMYEVYFGRNRYFEYVFKVIAVAVFVIVAIESSSYFLALIGVSLFFTISKSYKIAVLAKEIKEKNDVLFVGTLLNQKNSTLNTIITGLIDKFPDPKRENYYLE